VLTSAAAAAVVAAIAVKNDALPKLQKSLLIMHS
jgi:hypothetical protein